MFSSLQFFSVLSIFAKTKTLYVMLFITAFLMVGVAEKTIDVSGGLYRCNASFAEWLQYHFFPQTKEYGVMTSEESGHIADLVLCLADKEVEQRYLKDEVHPSLLEVALELCVIPNGNKHVDRYIYNPKEGYTFLKGLEDDEFDVAPVVVIRIMLELLNAKKMWKLPDSQHILNQATEYVQLSVAKGTERSQFGVAVYPENVERIGELSIGGEHLEVFKAKPSFCFPEKLRMADGSGAIYPHQCLERMVIYRADNSEL